jgi:glycosyltransferase involved in cell wall biosynthesis
VTAIASLYRGGEFIEAFMANITGLSFFRDWCELIVVDAASPDVEADTIRRYMADFPNNRYIRTPERVGIYPACSYQTVWAMLHRLMAVLVRPGRERLVGSVKVDETYIGGRDPGIGRGKGSGYKVLTGIAVEIKEPRGYGRCRLAPLADASAASLRAFVSDHVEPGATVITDSWKGYFGLDRCGYTHEARSQRAARLRGDE